MRKIKIFIAIFLFPAFFYAAQFEPVIEPPLEFNNIPLKNVLASLFLDKGNISYSLEADNIDDSKIVNLRLTKKILLSEALELILSPKGLKAEKDKTGIYRIRKGQEKVKYAVSGKKESGIFVLPPFDYKDTPVRAVLSTLFISLPEVSYVYETDASDLEGNMTFQFNKRMPLEDFLTVLLKSKPVTFYRDEKDIIHILKRADFERASTSKSSTYLGKRTVRDIIREREEKEIKEKKEQELIAEVNKEEHFVGPIEMRDAKLSGFLAAVISGAYVIDVNDIDSYGAVDLKLSRTVPLSELLNMALEPKNLRAEKDKSGIYHIKKEVQVNFKEKLVLGGGDIFYMEPPLEFNDVPLKTALEAIYMKTGKYSFVLDVDSGKLPFKINMVSKQRINIVTLLKILLEPNGLTFYKDSIGIVHIIKSDGTWEHPASPVLPEEKYQVEVQKIYFDPPFEYYDIPVKKVLKEIFEKSGLSYALEVINMDDFGKVNICLNERTQLETILVTLLDYRGLTFELDERGMVHIKEAVKQKTVEILPEVEEKSEISKRTDKYLEKTMGELGLCDLKGLPYKEGLIKVFSSIGRIFTDTLVTDVSVYGEITAEINGGKTAGVILREILQPKGLTFFINANGVYNIVKSGSREKYTAKRIYNYENSGIPLVDLKTYISKKITKEGKLEIDDSSKTLTITDTPEKIDEIEMYLYYGM